MKNIVFVAAIFALSFATGFTCSKNSPEQAAPQTQESAPAADAQAQMSAPAAGASGDATPAQPATQPAPTETK